MSETLYCRGGPFDGKTAYRKSGDRPGDEAFMWIGEDPPGGGRKLMDPHRSRYAVYVLAQEGEGLVYRYEREELR